MADPKLTPLHDEEAQAPVRARPHSGFLPIETNWFDRIFISVVIWIALSLLWLRFLEPAGLSLNFAHIIAVLLGLLIVRKG
jgi:predicted small integral membrane protein